MSAEREARLRAACERARFSYEHALAEARAKRDAGIAKAWAEFSRSAAREWALYLRVQQEYEAVAAAALAP